MLYNVTIVRVLRELADLLPDPREQLESGELTEQRRTKQLTHAIHSINNISLRMSCAAGVPEHDGHQLKRNI